MKRTLQALLLVLLLLVPMTVLGEATPLPYGLALGMDQKEAQAAFAADETLADIKPDFQDYGNGVLEYVFPNVPVPGTDLIAEYLTVQIDTNNSQRAERLSMISLELDAGKNSIQSFRKALGGLSKALGQPESDPFGEQSVQGYVEWGTVYANWAKPDVRIALTLNRMYEESVMLQYTSRINYDAADLAE
ncbi:MAG: hypothetical protein VB087_02820 [Candidatus Limiplasma sp.]|nr:hypothetical protein [Candidatus Limiplasma sp.]MEA5146523.1 hypothetical protein [Candidatus Limiplasma sp.]